MLVGITVMPEYFQSESVNGVLDRLEGLAGVTAVTTSPYVMAPADRRTGFREPPIDAGAGKVRLLDRTLWGKRELWARAAPSFRPNLDLYRTSDFRSRLQTARSASRHGFWINRYGHLSDEKLGVAGKVAGVA